MSFVIEKLMFVKKLTVIWILAFIKAPGELRLRFIFIELSLESRMLHSHIFLC